MKIHRLIAVAAIATLAVCTFAQGDPGGPGGPPPGQRGPGGPGMMGVGLQPADRLVRRSDVQSDLGLTDDQKIKLLDLFRSVGGPGGPDGGPGGGPGGPPPDGGLGGPPPDGGPGGPPPDGGPGGPPPDAGGTGGPGGGNDAFRARMDAMRKKISDGVNAILTDTQKTRLKEIQIQLAGNAAAADATVQKALKLTDDQKAKVAHLVRALSDANRSVFENMRSGQIEPDEAQTTLKKNSKILSAEIGKILTSDQAAALAQMGGKAFTATEQERGFGFGGPGGPPPHDGSG